MCVSIHILTLNILPHIYIKLQLQGTDPGVRWILTHIDFFKHKAIFHMVP